MATVSGPKQGPARNPEKSAETLAETRAPKGSMLRSLVDNERSRNAPGKLLEQSTATLNRIKKLASDITAEDIASFVKAKGGRVEQDGKGRVIVALNDNVCLFQKAAINVGMVRDFLVKTGHLRQEDV